MILEYNPFDKTKIKETKHGVINYTHNMGTVYVTHRKKEHYFVKYNGFGISSTELKQAYEEKVYWILIIYHQTDGTMTAYRIKMENIKYLENYNNNGDEQKIIPTKLCEINNEGKWL